MRFRFGFAEPGERFTWPHRDRVKCVTVEYVGNFAVRKEAFAAQAALDAALIAAGESPSTIVHPYLYGRLPTGWSVWKQCKEAECAHCSGCFSSAAP